MRIRIKATKPEHDRCVKKGKGSHTVHISTPKSTRLHAGHCDARNSAPTICFNLDGSWVKNLRNLVTVELGNMMKISSFSRQTQ